MIGSPKTPLSQSFHPMSSRYQYTNKMTSKQMQKRSFTQNNENPPSSGEHSLCLSCQSMFIQPTAVPTDEEKLRFRLRPSNIAESARNGCPLCVLVLARISSFRLRTTDVNRFEIKELDCKLNWCSDHFGSSRFNVAGQPLNDFHIELYLDSSR